MKPLFVLLVSFGLAIFAMQVFMHHIDFPLAARIAMSVMLLFTAIGHFAFPRGMMMMLSPFIPFRLALIYITGIIEIMAAIGLQIPGLRSLTAVLLIIFFIGVVPANIYAAANHIDYQKGGNDGSGLNYLWFRIPMQILFIVWTWLSMQ